METATAPTPRTALRTTLVRRIGWGLLTMIVLFAIVIAVLHVLARPAAPHSFFTRIPSPPIVMAHADDTGQGLWPGNTMIYLEGVAGVGVDVLEMDTHMTADGHIVLMHDDRVDRTTNGTGDVSSLTLAELQQLEVGVNWTQDNGATFPYRGAGLRVPTLEDVFTRFPDYPMIIEIKQTTPSMTTQLCALIRKHGMQNSVIIPSFSDATISEFRQVCPEVATAAGSNEARDLVLLNYIGLGNIVSPNYKALQVPERSGGITVLTEGFVRTAHQRGVQVHAWTINDPAEMRRLLEMGVDGIMTDRPDLLLEVLGRKPSS